MVNYSPLLIVFFFFGGAEGLLRGMWVAWHRRTLWHTWVRALYLLLLGKIGLILLRLLCGHVVVWQTLLRLWCHAASSSLHLCVCIVFGRVDGGFTVNAILVPTGRFWGVQASLVGLSMCEETTTSNAREHT
jgi:hypothetical protein